VAGRGRRHGWRARGIDVKLSEMRMSFLVASASLTVRVAPAARCTIAVVYDATVSRARGLGARRGGTITWTWRVGASTHPGRWPVTVECGKSGEARRLLHVV
jgi:hypothetical protein